MRSGFFAFSVAIIALLVVGCSTPASSGEAAKAQTVNKTRMASQDPSNSTTSGPANTTKPATDAQQSNGSQTTENNIRNTQSALANVLHTRRNQHPAMNYPTLQTGSQGTSVLRLQQMLAALGYLPVTWHALVPQKQTPNYEIRAYSYPPNGHWSWISQGIDSHLHNLWSPSTYTVVTEGAVMAFERDNGMQVDGIAGPNVWTALVQADMQHRKSPTGYSYVYVSKQNPERLTLWHNGKVVLSSLANTGIAADPTPAGTWPIYLRYRSQTMTGTNPNGTHYKDKGVPYVNYFYQGDAVHGFIRQSYGYPQSLGCVELPYANAHTAWNYLYYGALVTVG